MKITGFECRYISQDGKILNYDTFGNNVAVACPECDHSILFIAREHQKGSSLSKATECIGCKKRILYRKNN